MAASGDTIVASLRDPSGIGVGLLRSIDGGLNWTRLDTSVLKGASCLLFVDSFLFASDNPGIFRSADLGDHWTKMSDTSVRNFIAYDGDLYAAGGEVYHSSDQGVHWTGMNFPEVPADGATANSMTVYANRLYAGGSHGLYYTTKQEQGWQRTGAGSSQNAIVTFKNNMLMGSCRGLEFSNDSGTNWEAIDLPTSLKCVYSLATTDHYAYLADGYVFRSDSTGIKWKKSQDLSGVNSEAYNVLAISDTILTSGNGIYRSTNAGDSWIPSFGNYEASIGDVIATPSKLWSRTNANEIFFSSDYGGRWNGTYMRPIHGIGAFETALFVSTNSYDNTDSVGLYRTMDDGNSWEAVADTVIGKYFYDFVHTRDALFVLSDKGLVRSMDSGTTWKLIRKNPNANYWTVAASDTELLLGTESWTALRSTNNGNSWTNIGLYQKRLDAIAKTSTFAFAAYGEGVYRCALPDTNWVHADSGLQYSQTISFVTFSDDLFAGTDKGMFVTTNDGQKWIACSTGLRDSNIHGITIMDRYLFAATDHGVWRRPLSDFGISSVTQLSASNKKLRIYPNPLSHSTTTIAFTPETSGYADVSIVNLLGTQVAHLFSGELDAAEQHIPWEPTGLPNGMYECLVRINGRVEALPVVVAH